MVSRLSCYQIIKNSAPSPRMILRAPSRPPSKPKARHKITIIHVLSVANWGNSSFVRAMTVSAWPSHIVRPTGGRSELGVDLQKKTRDFRNTGRSSWPKFALGSRAVDMCVACCMLCASVCVCSLPKSVSSYPTSVDLVDIRMMPHKTLSINHGLWTWSSEN